MQDVLQVCEALSPDDNNQQKARLDRSVAMLTKLEQRGYAVREELGEYRLGQFDTDTDHLANDTQADKMFNLFLQRYYQAIFTSSMARSVPRWMVKLMSWYLMVVPGCGTSLALSSKKPARVA